MSDEAVYRTAPATQGLLIMMIEFQRHWNRLDVQTLMAAESASRAYF